MHSSISYFLAAAFFFTTAQAQAKKAKVGDSCTKKIACFRVQAEQICFRNCKRSKIACNKKAPKKVVKVFNEAACVKVAVKNREQCLWQAKAAFKKCLPESNKMLKSCKAKAMQFWKMCKDAKKKDCEKMKTSVLDTCYPPAEKERCKNISSGAKVNCITAYQSTRHRCRKKKVSAMSDACEVAFLRCKRPCFAGHRACKGKKVMGTYFDKACLKKCNSQINPKNCDKKCKREKLVCSTSGKCGPCL